MKITPLEIRQKSFEKGFRGYDKEEVDAFLQSLSKEWERLQEDYRDLKAKFEMAEREVFKLREVESSLFKTLKTAEETSAHLVDQAHKTADLMLREAQMNTDALLNDARHEAKNIIEEAEEQGKALLDDADDKVKEFKREFKNIENHRDNLLQELKNLANDTLERVNRLTLKTQKNQSEKFTAPLFEDVPPAKPLKTEQAVKPMVLSEEKKEEKKTQEPKTILPDPVKSKDELDSTDKKTEEGSFFDQF